MYQPTSSYDTWALTTPCLPSLNVRAMSFHWGISSLSGPHFEPLQAFANRGKRCDAVIVTILVTWPICKIVVSISYVTGRILVEEVKVHRREIPSAPPASHIERPHPTLLKIFRVNFRSFLVSRVPCYALGYDLRSGSPCISPPARPGPGQRARFWKSNVNSCTMIDTYTISYKTV